MMKMKIFLTVAMGIFALSFASTAANATPSCGRCCNCQSVRNFIIDEVGKHEDWLKDTFWNKKLRPALSAMTNQINRGLISNTTAIGGFMDAQNNIATMTTLQTQAAETANTFAPSEQLCRFASLGQSLAASEGKAKTNRLMMVKRSQDRQLGAAGSTGAEGSNADQAVRIRNVTKRYCNAGDNNGQMRTLCRNGGEDRFLNADIDFAGSFDSKPTLNIDLTGARQASSDDEQTIFALADNLFGHEVAPRPNADALKGGGRMNDSRVAFMDMRALVAKRSVAENSFNTLVGMKSQGAPGSKSFIASVLKELGVSDQAVLNYLGGNPSYDAQMEVLTKKIYQNPSFYVNLMDSPANVQRQYAAMQSFGLMQQRDIYDSILRSEMLLSLIVEMEIEKYQDEAQALLDR